MFLILLRKSTERALISDRESADVSEASLKASLFMGKAEQKRVNLLSINRHYIRSQLPCPPQQLIQHVKKVISSPFIEISIEAFCFVFFVG